MVIWICVTFFPGGSTTMHIQTNILSALSKRFLDFAQGWQDAPDVHQGRRGRGRDAPMRGYIEVKNGPNLTEPHTY